uniref:Uncharacterized protein n=1 Tax=Heterorhabditis bacteriophora TaxID=37862 RepID=A0A1I7X7W1_HETBA
MIYGIIIVKFCLIYNFFFKLHIHSLLLRLVFIVLSILNCILHLQLVLLYLVWSLVMFKFASENPFSQQVPRSLGVDHTITSIKRRFVIETKLFDLFRYFVSVPLSYSIYFIHTINVIECISSPSGRQHKELQRFLWSSSIPTDISDNSIGLIGSNVLSTICLVH